MSEVIDNDMIDAVFDYYERVSKAEDDIVIKGEYVVIKSHDYEIPLKDCKTVGGALSWIRHMQCKRWFTDEMAQTLCERICKYNGQQLWGGN